MAVINEIEVKVSADVKDIQRQITAVQNNLKQFESAVKKSTDTKEIEKFQASIATLKGKLEVLNATQNNYLGGSQNVVQGSNQAGNALLNLGRIAQDAPFGFIGISNNINPLLESFQRLKVETGTTGGALKALGSSLMGGAGVGFAVSVATGLLTVFADELFKTSKAAEDVDKLKQSLKELPTALDGVRATALSSGLQLQSFVDIAKNGQLPLSQRNEALKQANEILGEHGKKLTLANIATAEATKEVNLYTQAIIAQAVANKLADKAAELQISKTNALKDYLKAKNKEASYIKKINSEQRDGVETEEYAITQANIHTATLKKLSEETGGAAKALNETSGALTQMTIDLKNATTESTKLFGELGTKPKETKEGSKHIKTYKDIIAELRKEMRGLQGELDLGIINQNMFDENKVKVYNKAIKDLFEIKAAPAIIIGLDQEASLERLRVNLREFNKVYLPDLKTSKDALLKIPIEPKFETKGLSDLANELSLQLDRNKIIERFKKQRIPLSEKDIFKFDGTTDLTQVAKDAEALAAKMRDIYQISMGNAFAGIGEAIGNAILGKSDFIGALFQGLTQMLGDGLVQFGKQMIVASALLKALTEAFGGGQFGKSLIGGIALVALGSVLKGIKIGSNATGTDNWRGGLTMVGERGPELLNLPRGSQITPNHELGAIGGGMQPIVLTTAIRGNDLVLIQQRTNATLGRIG